MIVHVQVRPSLLLFGYMLQVLFSFSVPQGASVTIPATSDFPGPEKHDLKEFCPPEKQSKPNYNQNETKEVVYPGICHIISNHLTSSLALQSALFSSSIWTVEQSSPRSEFQTARCNGVIPFCINYSVDDIQLERFMPYNEAMQYKDNKLTFNVHLLLLQQKHHVQEAIVQLLCNHSLLPCGVVFLHTENKKHTYFVNCKESTLKINTNFQLVGYFMLFGVSNQYDTGIHIMYEQKLYIPCFWPPIQLFLALASQAEI